MNAFRVEGVDLEEGTVVVECKRELLVPMSRLLRSASPSNNNKIHLALWKLGERVREAARVLYDEVDAESCGIDILESDAASDIIEEDEYEMVS